MTETFCISAVQAAPVFLDLEATVSKACRLIETAAENGANLIVFPEAFLPGYPLWIWFIPPAHTHPLRALYFLPTLSPFRDERPTVWLRWLVTSEWQSP